MVAPKNNFKAALRNKKLQIGFWQSLSSITTAEISAQVGFDWLLIDGEHAQTELKILLINLG